MNRLKQCWLLLNLPCEGMSRLASESLDRELSRAERVALSLHTLYCGACRRFERQITLVSRTLRQLASRMETDKPLPGPRLPDQVREEIKRALRRN
jgi:hypothetical protein